MLSLAQSSSHEVQGESLGVFDIFQIGGKSRYVINLEAILEIKLNALDVIVWDRKCAIHWLKILVIS